LKFVVNLRFLLHFEYVKTGCSFYPWNVSSFVKKTEILKEVSREVCLQIRRYATPGNRATTYTGVCRLSGVIVFQSSNFVHFPNALYLSWSRREKDENKGEKEIEISSSHYHQYFV
jgi:hypothetical protein